jgi:sterol-4alpha-carboxylate 3-dehydrogenase (decarboxylating)
MAPIPQSSKQSLGNVLITGGCGMLGRHIVDLLLLSYSAKIFVVDLRTTNNRAPDSAGVKYYDGDITNQAGLTKIFEEVKPDVVIHTASPNGNDNAALHSLFYKVNVEGTKCVIEACQKTNVKALVYTCSASVISNNVEDLINADERWPVPRGKAQADYYSETKVNSFFPYRPSILQARKRRLIQLSIL